MQNSIDTYLRVSEFLNREADMLDHKEYQDWLALWSDSGIYIVPTDPDSKDFKNSLNIAYDDAHMRALRVERLESGEAVSTLLQKNTIRTLSRIRVLKEEDGLVYARCAYKLSENKKGTVRVYPASIEFVLKDNGDGFLIENKTVKLLLANDHLATISYIF